MSLFSVTSSIPLGDHALSSRVLDPVTGKLLNEDLNPFAVRGPELLPSEFAEADSLPSISITMSKSTYGIGDTVTASEFRLKNGGSSAATVELKVWLGLPQGSPLSFINLGSDGSLSLAGGVDFNLGPLTLFSVTSSRHL